MILLERERPLETLRAAFGKTECGKGQLALVEGEPGIGKTSLLNEFARAVGERCRIYRGWCEALFTPRTLGPLYDMALDLDPTIAEMLAASVRPEVLFAEVLARLQRSQSPIILIFEDIHWADSATLDLIQFLGRRISMLPALIILTFRSDDVDPGHALVQLLGGLPAEPTVRIVLSPLSSGAVSMMAEAAGRAGDGIFRATTGNPFFVTEVLANGDSDPEKLPDSVRDAVWARLARLKPSLLKLLEFMSITPSGIDRRLLSSALGDDALELADQCIARGLLRRDERGALSFRHDLARQATLERLSAMQRRSLHLDMERLIATLPESETSPALLSLRLHHAAAAGMASRVLELAPRVAAHSAALGGHRQAAAHLATALEHVADAPTELVAQLYESWAHETFLSLHGSYEPTIEAFETAISLWRKLGRVDKVGINLCRMSRTHWRQGKTARAVECVESAVEELENHPPGPCLALAYSMRSQLLMLRYDLDEAIAWGQRAMALADQLEEMEIRIHVLNNVGTAYLFRNDRRGRALIEESLHLALANGYHDHASRAYTNFAECSILLREFAVAEKLLVEGISFCTRHDLDSTKHYLLGRQAQLYMEQARFHDATVIAKGVMAAPNLPMVMHLPALTVLGRTRMRLGEDDAISLLERALEEGLSTAEPQRIIPVRLALTEAAWLAGDREAAVVQLDALSSLDPGNLRIFDAVEVAVWRQRFGDDHGFAADNKTIQSPRVLELQSIPLEAAEQWLELGQPYEAALSLLQVRGEKQHSSLRRAIDILHDIGAQPAIAVAMRLSREAGIVHLPPKRRRGPYTAARKHPLGLTQNEQKVLRLLLEGIGNKEIARRLSRSVRTIEHQVSSVLGKFNAASRLEVLLRAHGEPWLLDASTEPAPIARYVVKGPQSEAISPARNLHT